MNRLNRFAVAVATSALLTAPAVYAAPISINSPVHAMFGKSKSSTVKFTMRNDSATPIELKIDDKVVTLAPGKPLDLNLPAGTRILANTDTPNHATGSLIEEVSKEHAGATVVVR